MFHFNTLMYIANTFLWSRKQTAYRDLEEKTIKHYRLALYESIALILRYRLYHLTGKYKTMQLGNYIPSMTPSQKQARDVMYTFIMQS